MQPRGAGPRQSTPSRKADRWSEATASDQILAFIVIEIHKGAVVSRIASQSYPASSAFARQALAFMALSGRCRLLKLMEKRLQNVFNTPIRILWPHRGSTTTAMFEEALLSIGLLVVATKLAEGVLRRFGLSSIFAYTLTGIAPRHQVRC